MAYIRVKVNNSGIDIIQTYKTDDKSIPMSDKQPGELVLQVSSIKQAIADFKNHTSKVAKQVPQPVKQVVTSNVTHTWKWDKISKKHRRQIKSMYKKDDIWGIMALHNENKFSEENYCCAGYIPTVRNTVKKAIDNGSI